jgi:hypothetical protein
MVEHESIDVLYRIHLLACRYIGTSSVQLNQFKKKLSICTPKLQRIKDKENPKTNRLFIVFVLL